jgi:Ran GTPase-activating protein (RanGAP) involved in mRNA processing and transport
VRCPGAARLALAIRRAADRRERFDRALAYARERKSRGEDGHGDAFADADEMFAVDDEEGAQDVDERARRGSVDFVSADGTAAEPRRPTCRLRWLDLGSNLIGDRGGAALGDALGPRVPITRISLRDNPLGVEACAALGAAAARCPSLRRLDLAHCGFGDAGVAALAAGFMSAPTGRSTGLRVLQLGFNNIGEVGIKALAEAHAAGKLDHLEHLDLACNVLGPKGTAALVPMLEPSRREEARDARGGDAAATSASGGDYEDDSDDSDDSDEDFEDPDANAPSARPRRAGLYSLDIAVNNCSFDGGSTGERFGVKALLAALERNATLRHLNLRGNDLTPEMAGDVAEMLLENQTLRMVNVGYNKIYDEGTWELAEALSENAGIRGLDLQRNEISDAGAAHVRGLLRENTSIAEVDMRSNMLSPEVVSAFGDVFGTRVNCRWQQEPPKMDRSGAPQKRLVADGFGGGVKAKRAAKKAAKENAKRG